jgi:hypothetical protein
LLFFVPTCAFPTRARASRLYRMTTRTAHPGRLAPHEDDYSTMRRLNSEARLAVVARVVARTEVAETTRRLKHEVATQIAQIVDDRAFSTRPTFQIPNNWRCVHFPTPRVLFKVVACVDNKFVSIFAGVNTTYEIGKTYVARRGSQWPPLDECFFAFNTPAGALQAGFPTGSLAKKHPRVLLKIETKGNAYECCEHGRQNAHAHAKATGKTAVTQFKVTRIMTDAFRESALDKLRFGGV